MAAFEFTYTRRTREVVLSRIATLTPRERQVFELVIRGKQNKQIALALGGTEPR
jgi:FixJ family two-component response regulator